VIHSIANRTLIVWLWFGALSAIVGGAFGVFANGAGVPLAYLLRTPFDSYLVPGLILGIVVGGTQLAGAILLQRRHSFGLIAAVIAGLVMIAWIFVELAMLSEYTPLQAIYLALGAGELVLVAVTLGLLATFRRPVPELTIRPWTTGEL
jgi:hypothetical protein